MYVRYFDQTRKWLRDATLAKRSLSMLQGIFTKIALSITFVQKIVRSFYQNRNFFLTNASGLIPITKSPFLIIPKLTNNYKHNRSILHENKSLL
jgi:hypothetical protein